MPTSENFEVLEESEDTLESEAKPYPCATFYFRLEIQRSFDARRQSQSDIISFPLVNSTAGKEGSNIGIPAGVTDNVRQEMVGPAGIDEYNPQHHYGEMVGIYKDSRSWA